jgi:hypothetical protein
VDERSTAGAQGWNIDYLALTSARAASTTPAFTGQVLQWTEGSGKRRLVAAPGTLLGPEGSGDELDSFWIGIRRSGPLLVDEPRPVPLDNQPVCGVGATPEDGGPPVC